MLRAPEMENDSVPLDSVTFTALPMDQQDILKAFFTEADALLEEPADLRRDIESKRLIPTESLQLKYDAIVEFKGDVYCPVKQRVKRFVFTEMNVTLH